MTLTSVYTPSVLEAEALEALFVAREPILTLIGERILVAENEPVRNHTLLIGPRGAGKTHLVALAFHRAAQRVAGGTRLRLAWLPEDPWGLASYRILLREMLDREESIVAKVDRHLDEEALEYLLRERAEIGGPLVVFLENLDQVLETIDEKGQRRLRHLAQSGSLLLVATTTRLGRSLASTDGPFYGFFTETALQPFTLDEATAMLQRIAERRGENGLALDLATQESQVRLRTIAHLAGGQPRIWAILADSLSISGVLSSSEALLSIFDRLTPYYQEQLSRLSPNQRLIVTTLVDEDRAMTVKDLAASTGISQRSLSSTLGDLKQRSWVAELDTRFTRMLQDKRVTYYDLAGPLSRVVFQMKNTKNGELPGLLMDFLGLWFTFGELVDADYDRGHESISFLQAAGTMKTLLTRIISGLGGLPLPPEEFLAWVTDCLLALEANGDPVGVMELPRMIRSAIESLDGDGIHAAISRLFTVALLIPERSPDSAAAKQWAERLLAGPAAPTFVSLFLARSGRTSEAARLVPDDVVLDDIPTNVPGIELLVLEQCFQAAIATRDLSELEEFRNFSGEFGRYAEQLILAAADEIERRVRRAGKL